MNKVKITAIRKADYKDWQALYENPIEHTCDVLEGQSWVSHDGKQPEGLCPEAWRPCASLSKPWREAKAISSTAG